MEGINAVTTDELESAIANLLLDGLNAGLTSTQCDEAIMEAQIVLRTVTALDAEKPTTARLVN